MSTQNQRSNGHHTMMMLTQNSTILLSLAFCVLAMCAAAGPNGHRYLEVASNNDTIVSITVQCKPEIIPECRQQIMGLAGASMVHELESTDLFAITVPMNQVQELMDLNTIIDCHKNVKRGTMPEVDLDIYDDVEHERDSDRLLQSAPNEKQLHSRNLRELPSYAVDYVNARAVWNLPGGQGTKGAGVKICVVEDGIAKDAEDLDYSKITSEPSMLGTGTVFEHGLRVTGIISAQPNDKGSLGIAPDAQIIGVEWDKTGSNPDSSDVIAALLECKEKGANIITFSVGGFQFSPEEERFCQEMVESGIVLVGASGNFNGDPRYAKYLYYPANYDSVITVGSVNWSGEVSSFSSRGEKVDLVAPGENVQVISKALAAQPTAISSGTSFSAPLVAGAAALLKSLKPSATPQEIRKALINSATRPSSWPAGQTRDNNYGAGIMNVFKAAEYMMGDIGKTVPTLVHINFDQWPGETLFEVLDSKGKTVMEAGPFPFTYLTGHGVMKKVDQKWSLPRGCYTLIMKDLANDGICCKYGNGSFYIEYDGSRQVETTFSTAESKHQFGNCGPVVPICGNGKLEGNEECDDGNKKGGDGCSASCRVEICGNGRKDAGEECDDGNKKDGDGCSAACRSEVCGNSRADFGEECDDGNQISGDGCSASCEKEVCGNGRRDYGEECDDGNNVSGDGCSAKCQAEICGNGRVDIGEECDDGNTRSGDGCSNKCEKEVCGNGRRDYGEECDDGNAKSGDGCSDKCEKEVCSNGRVDFGEECDDGNSDNGDGCSDKCLAEICGNSRLDVGEECDDGNTIDGDGCSSECKRELAPAVMADAKVIVRLTLDKYAAESNWNIKDAKGNIVRSGDGYSGKTNVYDGFDLPGGCYEFTINDTYGDGMCCSGGVGEYSVTYNGKTHIRDLGFRGSSKTTKFGTCSNMDSEICPTTFYFRVHTDNNSFKENKLKLENVDSGETIIDIDRNMAVDNTLYLHQCMQINQCYKATFIDTQGDGISRRPYSGKAKEPIYAQFDGKGVLAIPFDDTCKERCIYMGSCASRACQPVGCKGGRRLRGSILAVEDVENDPEPSSPAWH